MRTATLISMLLLAAVLVGSCDRPKPVLDISILDATHGIASITPLACNLTAYPIQTRVRLFTPDPCPDPIQINLSSPGVRESGHKHAYLQLANQSDTTGLETLGVKELGNYRASKENNDIYRNTYIVSIPISRIDDLRRLDNIIWVGDIPPMDKVEQNIWRDSVALVLKDDLGRYLVMGSCYDDVPESICRKAIDRRNVSIKKYGESGIFVVLATNDEALKLAEEDSVVILEAVYPMAPTSSWNS